MDAARGIRRCQRVERLADTGGAGVTDRDRAGIVEETETVPPKPPPPPPLYSREPIDPSRQGYTLVVSSSRSPRLGEDVSEEYRTRGYRTGILRLQVDRRRLYVVGIGQFETRSDATEARERLANRIPYDTWILRIRDGDHHH